jgi:heme/copper-type cytochrome/quinol oxidase subunit 2
MRLRINEMKGIYLFGGFMKRLTTLLSALVAMMSTNVFAEYGLNMTEGVTSISHDIYTLHMMVFWVCVAIAVIVFGVMAYSIFAHRQSKGAVAANFHESTKAELVWTIVPIIIFISKYSINLWRNMQLKKLFFNIFYSLHILFLF